MNDHIFETLFREMVEAVRAHRWEVRADLPHHRVRLREIAPCGRLCEWVESRLPDSPNDPRSDRMEALLEIIDEVAFGETSTDQLLQEAREEVFASTIAVESWTEIFGLRFPADRVDLGSGLTIEWLGEQRHAELSRHFMSQLSDFQILPLRRGGDDPDSGWIVCERWEAARPFDQQAAIARWDLAVRKAGRVLCLASLLFAGGWRSGASFHLVRGRAVSPTMRNRPPWGSGDPHRDLSEEDVSLLRDALQMVEANLSRYAPTLHWYEAGLFQRERPWLRFVSWAMALEALALDGATGPGIGRRLSEALQPHGVPNDEMKLIWDLRSDVVHGRVTASHDEFDKKAIKVRNVLRTVFMGCIPRKHP